MGIIKGECGQFLNRGYYCPLLFIVRLLFSPFSVSIFSLIICFFFHSKSTVHLKLFCQCRSSMRYKYCSHTLHFSLSLKTLSLKTSKHTNKHANKHTNKHTNKEGSLKHKNFNDHSLMQRFKMVELKSKCKLSQHIYFVIEV
jgi:hypothetical protein